MSPSLNGRSSEQILVRQVRRDGRHGVGVAHGRGEQRVGARRRPARRAVACGRPRSGRRRPGSHRMMVFAHSSLLVRTTVAVTASPAVWMRSATLLHTSPRAEAEVRQELVGGVRRRAVEEHRAVADRDVRPVDPAVVVPVHHGEHLAGLPRLRREPLGRVPPRARAHAVPVLRAGAYRSCGACAHAACVTGSFRYEVAVPVLLDELPVLVLQEDALAQAVAVEVARCRSGVQAFTNSL